MDQFFRFAYPVVLYVGIPLLVCISYMHMYWHKSPSYRFSLFSFIAPHMLGSHSGLYILRAVRSSMFVLFILMLARPQWVDQYSRLQVEGIDIVIALDVSGSMECFDDMTDRRKRIDVAKQEAVNFVQKRPHDQIGLVLFGSQALSRCGITHDKQLLTQLIQDVTLGEIDATGTVLAKGLITAINRLKHSQATSRVIILLTDGVPTAELDIDPQKAIDIAKKFNIKVYTIGIGSDQGAYFTDEFGRTFQVQVMLNKSLLETIATQTSGRFFEAHKPDDIKRIYDTIDMLEKTEYETDIYVDYHEYFLPFLLVLLGLCCLELFFSTFVWLWL